jgi:hypothetical protein
MAFKIMSGAIKNYIGTSADSKPTDSTVPLGSKFLETDTKDVYIYDGSAWHQMSANVVWN